MYFYGYYFQVVVINGNCVVGVLCDMVYVLLMLMVIVVLDVGEVVEWMFYCYYMLYLVSGMMIIFNVLV